MLISDLLICCKTLELNAVTDKIPARSAFKKCVTKLRLISALSMAEGAELFNQHGSANDLCVAPRGARARSEHIARRDGRGLPRLPAYTSTLAKWSDELPAELPASLCGRGRFSSSCLGGVLPGKLAAELRKLNRSLCGRGRPSSSCLGGVVGGATGGDSGRMPSRSPEFPCVLACAHSQNCGVSSTSISITLVRALPLPGLGVPEPAAEGKDAASIISELSELRAQAPGGRGTTSVVSEGGGGRAACTARGVGSDE